MALRIRTLPTLAALALAAPAAAQDIVPLVVEGDPVPGIGLVTRIDQVHVHDTGEWFVEADTDFSDTHQDSVLLGPAGVRYREGEAVLDPVGGTLRWFRTLSLDRQGRFLKEVGLEGVPSGEESAIYLDDTLLYQEGQTIDVTGLSPGTLLIMILDARLNDAGQVSVMALIDDPGIFGSQEFVIWVCDPNGTDVVVAKEGDMLPGAPLPVSSFEHDTDEIEFADGGHVIYTVHLWGSGPNSAIYVGDSLQALEDGPSPVAGRTWAGFVNPPVSVNDQGAGAFLARLNGDPATDLLIVSAGQKLVQEGDVLPDITPYSIDYFGGGDVCIARTGQVLWFGRWDGPDPFQNSGLFVDHELVVHQGVSQVGARTIVSISAVDDGYDISGNGRWVIFNALLDNGDDGAFLLDRGLGVITPACQAPNPHSAGHPARLSVAGFDVAGGLPLRLIAQDLPPHQFGYFLVGQQTANIVGPGGSQGVLCLTGNVGRYASAVASGGPAGYLELAVDTNLVPMNPAAAIQSGESWTFQCWFRDSNPGPTSNFSDAVTVLFR